MIRRPLGDAGAVTDYLVRRFDFLAALAGLPVARLGRGFANQAELARRGPETLKAELCATVGRYAIWMQDLIVALEEADAIRTTDPDRSAALVRAVREHLTAFVHLQSQPESGTGMSFEPR